MVDHLSVLVMVLAFCVSAVLDLVGMVPSVVRQFGRCCGQWHWTRELSLLPESQTVRNDVEPLLFSPQRPHPFGRSVYLGYQLPYAGFSASKKGEGKLESVPTLRNWREGSIRVWGVLQGERKTAGKSPDLIEWASWCHFVFLRFVSISILCVSPK